MVYRNSTGCAAIILCIDRCRSITNCWVSGQRDLFRRTSSWNINFGRLRAASISRKIPAGNETYPRGYPAGHHMLIEDWNYVFVVTSQGLGALPTENPIRVGGQNLIEIGSLWDAPQSRNQYSFILHSKYGGQIYRSSAISKQCDIEAVR